VAIVLVSGSPESSVCRGWRALLPDFRENYLIAHASLRPESRWRRTRGSANEFSKSLNGHSGVKSIAEQIGRAENGQDPDAPNKSEFECT